MLQLSQTALGDQLQIGHYSHPGLSGKNNEDYYGVFSVRTASGECLVAAVADGIGGSVGGEQASTLTIRTLSRFLEDERYAATSLDRRLEQAVLLANREVYNRAQSDPALLGMGTTIVAAALDGDRLHVVHAGDSRAYLVRGGKAWQLTLDHSWAQEAIEAGRITPEAAKTHPNRHVIRRYLGINEDAEVDLRVLDPNRGTADGTRLGAIQAPIQTRPGDAILLCSDGLTDEVGDEEIAKIVSRYAPEEAARRLVDAANAAGGADNITAVILQRGGGKAAAAGGRSPLAAIGLAAAALLIVGGLGWLLASGALVPNATPTALSTAALTAVAAAAADNTAGDSASAALAASPTAAATAAADLPTEEATEPTETTAAGLPAEALPTATEILAATEPATSGVTPTSTPQPAASQTATATLQPTFTASSNPASGDAEPVTTGPGADASPTPVPPTPELPPPSPEPSAAVPTSTPVSRPGPSPTMTPTSTIISTAVPRQSSGARQATPTSWLPISPDQNTASASPTVVPPSQGGGPTGLLNVMPGPNSQHDVADSVNFTWSANDALQPSQVYELVFWPLGKTWREGKSPFSASTSSSLMFSAAANMVDQEYLKGTYKWGVLLAETGPNNYYNRLRPLGEYQITFSGGDSSSSSDGDNGDDNTDGPNPGGRP